MPQQRETLHLRVRDSASTPCVKTMAHHPPDTCTITLTDIFHMPLIYCLLSKNVLLYRW